MILPVNRDHQQPVIRRERHAVRRLADVDRLDDFVGGRVDDVDRGRAVAAYVDVRPSWVIAMPCGPAATGTVATTAPASVSITLTVLSLNLPT